MKFLKMVLLSAAVGLCMTPQARTQDTATAEALLAARALTAIMSASIMSDFADKRDREIWPAIEAAFQQQYPNIDGPTLLELRAEFERAQNAAMRQTMDDAPVIYARLLTAQEIRELIAFYRTPIGMKTLRVLPQAAAEMLTAMAPRIQEGADRVRLGMLDILRKRGYER